MEIKTMLDEALDKIEMCYGVKLIDRESYRYNVLRNYKKYDIKESIKYARKIENFIGTNNRKELEIFLLKQEFLSRNPFWIKDFYKVLLDGPKMFEYMIQYNNRHYEAEIYTLIDTFIQGVKVGNFNKIGVSTKNIFKRLFDIIGRSCIMEDEGNLDYVVMDDKNKIYTLNKCKGITLNLLYKGTYETEFFGKWNEEFNLNELDSKIGFDTAMLRVSTRY